MISWLFMFALSALINSGGGASRGFRRAWDVVAALLLGFVTSAVAIGVQVVALIKGNPHRFEVIHKTDPRGRRASLVTPAEDGGSMKPDDVTLVHDRVVIVPEPSEWTGTLTSPDAGGRPDARAR